jgi:hypothetical protein
MQLAEVVPTTMAGAVALMVYVIEDSEDLECPGEWTKQALMNSVEAVRRLTAGGARL